ncbi:sulfatase-like hydrolase/transferase [Polaribacter sp. Q13]|uniref:sulfatase-like hydrolase/transferase n=1 Tax=Polaribacter sp. Q13 TaxID=2806551 RepID=UPI001C015D4F|nr:sulfatase-like hydrolase/transferase [Polaribacter sp. Q13]QVY66584.1 sulfatase-like hydrolase/transferase [Polaribacter sp. Q13]
MVLFSLNAQNKDYKTQDKPNIVLVLIDDMGWKDMGCSGSKYYETPNMDALAASGMRFENGYSSSPVCAPSRGAIYTGKSPGRTKYSTVYNGGAAADERLFERSKFRDGKNLIKIMKLCTDIIFQSRKCFLLKP